MSNGHWIKNPNSPLKVFIWIVVLVFGYAIIRTIVETGHRESLVNFDLTVLANKINRSLPTMVDTETRLEKVVGGRRKLTFYMSLPNVEKGEMDVLAFKTNMLRSAALNYKTNAAKAYLRAQNVIFEYQYNDKNGNLILKFEVSPKDF